MSTPEPPATHDAPSPAPRTERACTVAVARAARAARDKSSRARREWFVRYLCAQVAVVLLFGPYLANLTTRAELIGRHWRTQDAVFLIALLAALALACVAVESAGRRWTPRWCTRLIHHVFVLAVGGGILANVAFYVPQITLHGMPVESAWLALFGLTGYSLATHREWLVARTRQLCQILSPIVVILPVHLLNCETYPSPMDPLPPPEPAAGRAVAPEVPPVYVFVFDMWSYERTFDHHRVRADMPNVAALADRGVVFHNAHSPGTMTVRSMPRLLYDTDWDVVTKDGRVGFESAGGYVAPRELDSLFRAASNRGYRSWLVGFGLPYRLWLGDEVDVCRGYHWCQWYPGGTLLERAGAHLARAMRYWTDPWARTFHARYHLALDATWAVRIHQSVTRDVLYCLRHEPPNTIALFHCPFPHYPYVQDRQSEYRPPSHVRWDQHNLEEYELALRNLDHMVGRFVAALTQADRFDAALIVLTADHEWMFDPDREGRPVAPPLTHVPLIVKLPRQHEPQVVETRFETRRIRTLLDHTLDPAVDLTDSRGLLARVLAACERPTLTGR